MSFQLCGIEGNVMQRKCNLIRLLALIITLSVMVPAPQALAMSDEIIKQRIEDAAGDTFRLEKTKVEVAVEDSPSA